MIFYLHTTKSDQSGFDHLAALASDTGELYSSQLELDFSRCGFFDANMAAPLAAILAGVADRFNRITIVNVSTPVSNILRKNRFLLDYGYKPLPDSNHTTLPYVRIQLSDEGLFSEYLSRHMYGKGIPRMTKSMEKYFQQSVYEVFQNCVIHSGSTLGIFVCGQFYPQLQRLDLTIADAGVGIRTNVRRYLKNKISSISAIRWAIQEAHTTKTVPHPGGVGLKFLTDFVQLNKGKLQITSRYGFYEKSGETETFTKLEADFPGTSVNLEINTSDSCSYCLNTELSAEDIF